MASTSANSSIQSRFNSMASTSTSPIRKRFKHDHSPMAAVQTRFKYDVFLSFRGEDTRKNFVDHLYHALKQRNIITYKDDEEIKKGERISDELIRSIKDSKFYIIIFSKNYASSSWCLDELVKIMDCQKTKEQTAYPVFFDVEPTEVRNQSGAVEEAFAKHKDKEDAGKWGGALREAADLAGWELKNIFDGHEAKLIQKIVEEISLNLRFINSSIDGKLIGMETRVKDVISSLEINADDVRMLGIKGMGGAGKTTLARAVFDQMSCHFEGSSFVRNVREISKNQSYGLMALQKQVLSDVLNDPNIIVRGVSDMKKMLCGRKVLLVLDDVDKLDQLEELAGELNWFKLGSRVIITTREEQVLVAHGVPKNLILDVNLLSHEEANCLFNRYAFGRMIPSQGYEELSCQVVRYAAGLPLTIKVLGSFLRGKDELEWVDALERLKKIPLKETLEILELSYNGLEEDYKEIFLDVACILKGWEKEEAIIALESCGYHARNGLRVLEQKSLITVSYGYLSMHDHIEEMGKNIVRRLHPNEPYRHSRLWIKNEIEDILVEDKGTEVIRCITVHKVNRFIVMKGLRKMKKLRFLEFEDNFNDLNVCNDIGEDSLYLPNGLRYLCWYKYPFTCLPTNFQANNLVSLKMMVSNMNQLWDGGERKVLAKLRFIELDKCKLRSMNIGLMMNVERITLTNCEDLVELHMPAESLKLKNLHLKYTKLKTINLKGARNLETLTVDICVDLVELDMPVESLKLESLCLDYTKLKTLNFKGARNLETLTVFCCRDLVELDMPVESLKLESLRLEYTKLKTLNLKGARNLETLTLMCCDDLEELHLPVESLKLKHLFLRCCKLKTLNLTWTLSLETLHLEECEDLVELHMPGEGFKLGILHICRSKLRTLNLAQAQNLQTLKFEKCKDLVELHLPVESLKLKRLSVQYCLKLKTIDLGLTPNLEQLDVEECYNLVDIHAPIGSIKQLVRIKLSDCVRFKPILINPWFPDVGSSAELHLTARSLDICPLHPDNNSPKFQFDCIYKERVPLSTGNLEKLLSFGLCACTDLVRFSESICSLQRLGKLTLAGSIPDLPKNLDQLECLEELYLLSTVIKHIPDSICMLKHLKVLQLKSCWLLEQLPEDLGRLECLEELYLTECIFLRNIPNSICEMKRLKRFHLQFCVLVEKLPEEIGRLKCLKELNIEGAGVSRLPQSIFQLKGLLIDGYRWRLESYGLTFLFERSTYTSYCYI